MPTALRRHALPRSPACLRGVDMAPCERWFGITDFVRQNSLGGTPNAEFGGRQVEAPRAPALRMVGRCSRRRYGRTPRLLPGGNWLCLAQLIVCLFSSFLPPERGRQDGGSRSKLAVSHRLGPAGPTPDPVGPRLTPDTSSSKLLLKLALFGTKVQGPGAGSHISGCRLLSLEPCPLGKLALFDTKAPRPARPSSSFPGRCRYSPKAARGYTRRNLPTAPRRRLPLLGLPAAAGRRLRGVD